MAKQILDEWALGVLLHAHAIVACPDCGFMRLKPSPYGLDYAHALAEFQPFPGKSKIKCIEAIDTVFDSLGDECPEC